MRRTLAAGMAVVALVASACSESDGVITPSADQMIDPSARAAGLAYVPPESLLEQPPLNQTAELLAKGRRSVAFCDALIGLEALSEPQPYDLEELVSYASDYHGVVASVDFSREMDSSYDDRGRRRSIPMPPGLADTVRTLQAHMYGYLIRVSALQELSRRVDSGGGAPNLEEEVDTAFLKLVNSAFTDAERSLSRAEAEHCVD